MDAKAGQNFLALGAWTMFTGVALGAFGAHALKDWMTEAGKAIYETGVHYHLVHGLALLLVSQLPVSFPRAKVIGWLFFVGTIIFSGSLYILGVSGVKLWGAVTPFGGLCYLIGWFLLAFGAGQMRRMER